MKNRTWRAAGVLGSALILTIGTGTLVMAEGTTTEVTGENAAASIAEANDWENKAVADVKTYANVRAKASAEAKKVGVMPKGAAAKVLEKDGAWTKIASGEIEGFVKTDLLAFEEEAKNLYEETYGTQGSVTASSLRVRNKPSLDGKQIGSRQKGSTVEILDQEGEWYQIKNGESDAAYVAEEYIEIKEATALTMAEYQKQQATVSVSGGELDLLAAIIQCEAGGESHTGKVAVGAVIMNRVRSGQFPNSISEVVYQSGQFSPVASGKLSQVLSQGARSDCYQAAKEALSGSNPVGGALYFNSGRGRGQQIGNQHFY